MANFSVCICKPWLADISRPKPSVVLSHCLSRLASHKDRNFVSQSSQILSHGLGVYFRQLVPLLTNMDISLIISGRLYSSCVWSMLHRSETCTTTTTTVLWPCVWDYREKRSPTHTYPDHQPSFIIFIHLLGSKASSLFNLRAWQSFCTVSPSPLWVCLLVWNPPLHTYLHPIIVSF